MTQRATVRVADMNRAMKAAAKNPGWRVEVQGGKISFLPNDADTPSSAAEDMERRMREAFGE